MRIDSTQVVVTAKVETVDAQVISIRQSIEAENKLSAIYDLFYINPKPLGKRKSMLHPNQTLKKLDIENQGVTKRVAAMCVKKHSFVHKLLDLKPGDISFLYFA